MTKCLYSCVLLCDSINILSRKKENVNGCLKLAMHDFICSVCCSESSIESRHVAI